MALKITRQVGDTQVVLAMTLTRPDGTAVDLSDMSDVLFAMVTPAGVFKVAETSTNVTVTDAAAGEVQYALQDADVDTAGTYYAYFITEDASGKQDTFPVKRGELKIIFVKPHLG